MLDGGENQSSSESTQSSSTEQSSQTDQTSTPQSNMVRGNTNDFVDNKGLGRVQLPQVEHKIQQQNNSE